MNTYAGAALALAISLLPLAAVGAAHVGARLGTAVGDLVARWRQS